MAPARLVAASAVVAMAVSLQRITTNLRRDERV